MCYHGLGDVYGTGCTQLPKDIMNNHHEREMETRAIGIVVKSHNVSFCKAMTPAISNDALGSQGPLITGHPDIRVQGTHGITWPKNSVANIAIRFILSAFHIFRNFWYLKSFDGLTLNSSLLKS